MTRNALAPVRLTLLGFLAITACADKPLPTEPPILIPTVADAAEIESVEYVVGPLIPNFAEAEFAFPDGRLHIRHLPLTGPVSGDLEGTSSTVLDITFDARRNGRGHGEAVITTAEGDWVGTSVVEFVGIWTQLPTGPTWVPLATSSYELHGPDGALLRAVCQERLPAYSETLDCSGTITRPRG